MNTEVRISPKKIYREISKTIIGQHKAKKMVSNALYIHLLRLFELAEVRATTNSTANMTNKSNVLILGPSGCGKTAIVRAASKAVRTLTGLDIFNLCEIDASGLSAKGWEGDHLDDLIGNFYKEDLKGNQDLMDTSIVYLDEIDKKVIPAIGAHGTDHNKSSQFSMLKIIEGSDVTSDSGSKFGSSHTKFKTHNTLFILSGSFDDLRKKRQDEGTKLGFTYNNLKEPINNLHEALLDTGMIPELVGRIGFIEEINQLNKDELIEIMKRNDLDKIESIVNRAGISIKDDALLLDEIAEQALKNKTGARGLDVQILKSIEDKIFESEINLAE